MLRLPLRIYYQTDPQDKDALVISEFTVKRTDSLMSLALICTEYFKIEVKDLAKNFRLRSFDEKKKTKLSVYDGFEDSLLKLRFNFTTVLIIEAK